MIEIWKVLSFYNEAKVYKRGINTLETSGSLINYNPNGIIVIESATNEPFSIAGDSGSLVSLREDDFLVPIGIHYCKDRDKSLSVAIWKICCDFCVKQGLEEIELRFMNPTMEGVANFKLDEFSSQSGASYSRARAATY